MTGQSSEEPTNLEASALPFDGVNGPKYDRSGLRPAIVHIGVGGFHRAHLATYVDELCASGNTNWSIVGSGVMAGDTAMRDALETQDHLYTLITRGAGDTDVQIIGSIVDYLLAADDVSALVAQIANPTTQIVSLTVTEGGYPVDDQTGEYNPASSNAGETSAFGIIAAALDERRRTHAEPITVMSCDNIMTNGAVTKTATVGEAARFGPALLEWISTSVAFPNSMVDRITPSTADTDCSWLKTEHGLIDRWPVVTEPFRQWVIEDHFAGDRLPLEDLDVIITDDVEPYEFMKLRLLNAGHSCLAYLGALDGIETVDVAMADPSIREYLNAFLHQEAKVVLPEVKGIDIDAYIASLIERFSNPAIGDQISRLCLDGTAKFPKFLMPTVIAQIQANGPLTLSALALAGWCKYLGGIDDHGQSIKLSADPMLDDAVRHAQRSQDDPSAFLELCAVFPPEVRESPRFQLAFADCLASLRTGSMRAAVKSAMDA